MDVTDLIRWRPAPPLRKALLLTHIEAGGAWLGLDLALGAVVLTAFTADAASAAAGAVTLAAFATWPLIVVSLVALGTGVLLGIGSKYGLARYWWVLIKLALTLILTTLVTLVLAPGMHAIRGQGLAALTSGAELTMSPTMLFPPIVSTTAVTVAMALSVFKPWGRIRRRANKASPLVKPEDAAPERAASSFHSGSDGT